MSMSNQKKIILMFEQRSSDGLTKAALTLEKCEQARQQLNVKKRIKGLMKLR